MSDEEYGYSDDDFCEESPKKPSPKKATAKEEVEASDASSHQEKQRQEQEEAPHTTTEDVDVGSAPTHPKDDPMDDDGGYSSESSSSSDGTPAANTDTQGGTGGREEDEAPPQSDDPPPRAGEDNDVSSSPAKAAVVSSQSSSARSSSYTSQAPYSTTDDETSPNNSSPERERRNRRRKESPPSSRNSTPRGQETEDNDEDSPQNQPDHQKPQQQFARNSRPASAKSSSTCSGAIAQREVDRRTASASDPFSHGPGGKRKFGMYGKIGGPQKAPHHLRGPISSSGQQQQPLAGHGTRLADRMVHRMVEEPLEQIERHWTSAPATHGNNEVLPQRMDFPYDSTQDPALQQYWSRQAQVRKIHAREKRRLLAKQLPPRAQTTDPTAAAGSRHSPSRSAVSGDSDGADNEDEEEGGKARGKRAATTDDEKVSPARTVGSVKSNLNASSLKLSVRPEWNESDFPLNNKPVESVEFLTLRAILVPNPSLSCKVKVPNVDLKWVVPLLDGSKKLPADDVEAETELRALVAKHATRSLETMDYDQLAEDHIQYHPGNPFETTLINSPRSVVTLLRNGMEAYSLLKRPIRFHAKFDSVHAAPVRHRYERAESERQRLVQSLKNSYRTLCQRFSAEECLATLIPPTISSQAKQRLDEKAQKERRNLEFMEDRLKRITDLENAKREENARRAVAMEANIKRRAEDKAADTRAKSEKIAEQLAQKKRLLDRIKHEQYVMVGEMKNKMETKIDNNNAKVAKLKRDQRDHAHEKQEKSRRKRERSQALLHKQQEELRQHRIDVQTHKQALAELNQQKLAEEQAKRADRQARDKERQHQSKERSEEIQAEVRETVEARLREAEERLAEFTRQREEQRKFRALLAERRQRQIEASILAAQQMEEERQEALRQKQEALDQRLLAREHDLKILAEMDGERAHFDRALKQRIVESSQQQVDFAKMVEFARVEQKVLAVEAFESDKKECAMRSMQNQMQLRIRRDELREESRAERHRVDVEAARKIYDITNPKEKLYHLPSFENVASRTDHGKSGSHLRKEQGTSSTSPKRNETKKSSAEEDELPPIVN